MSAVDTDGTFAVRLMFDARGPFVRMELKDASGAVVGTLNLHEFDHAMQMASDLMETARLGWPQRMRAIEAAEAASRPSVIAVIAVPLKGTVPCAKGHLHAAPEDARACESDARIPGKVGAVKH